MKILFLCLIICSLIISFSSCKTQTSDSAAKVIRDENISQNIPLTIVNEPKKDSTDKGDKNQTGIGFVNYHISKLPEELKYSGAVVSMAKWKDINVRKYNYGNRVC